MPQSKQKPGRKRGRGDLSDEQWDLIQGLFPKQKRGGKWNDHRLMFDGILRTGAPWRDLPERYGKWGSVYHRFNRWRKDGTFDRVLKALRIRLDKDGYIDWDLWCVDGSNVRASRSAAVGHRRVPLRRTRLPQHPARPPLRDSVAATQRVHRPPCLLRAQKFPEATS